MVEIRGAILNDTFSSFMDDFLKNYKPTDEQTRISQKQKWLEARNSDNPPIKNNKNYPK
jgi:hypothetical protein